MSKSDPADGHNAELAGRLARFTVAATASLVLSVDASTTSGAS